ncbi:hypothetical protein BDN70DRAFT_871102 [Pholiota conissans]|uniref:Cyanovirin-N domain-containing protein n=1 Tax=Pholiota conissans TaxID=109636 RepID=A0A9P6D6C6_9AGAR|nr:hypothetical protein BDN70DRAFT_871102 [Pholiota conissans]
MNSLPLISTLFLAVIHAVAANTPQPDSNAAASCFDWSIVPNTANVAATCLENDSLTQHNSVIELSQCTGNQNGVIGCQVNGGAGASCVFSNIQTNAPSGGVSNFLSIDAACLNAAGVRVTTANFNLDACLSNFNGNLGC